MFLKTSREPNHRHETAHYHLCQSVHSAAVFPREQRATNFMSDGRSRSVNYVSALGRGEICSVGMGRLSDLAWNPVFHLECTALVYINYPYIFQSSLMRQ